MTHTTNNPLPKPAPTAYSARDIDGVKHDVTRLIQSRCPDTKSQKKTFAILNNALHCATNLMMYGARDMLWDISGGFEELCDIAAGKATDAQTYNGTLKWDNRAKFYAMLANWASASLEMTEKLLESHQSPPVDYPKDAEDDSDPYVKPSAGDAPMPDSLEWARAKLESDLFLGGYRKVRVDDALRNFDLEANDFLSGSVSVCDILERFGDEYASLSDEFTEAEDSQFADACVMISDAIRAEIAENTISAKANYMTPSTTPRNEVCHSAEPEDVGQMWEVCGDPHRALFYTKLHAEHWAREMFPTENADKRYARIQYRNILKFPA